LSSQSVGFSLLILSVGLLIGKMIRVKVRWVQRLFLPGKQPVAVLISPPLLAPYLFSLRFRRFNLCLDVSLRFRTQPRPVLE